MATCFHLRVWTRFLAPVEEVWRIKTDLGLLSAEFGPIFAFRAGSGAMPPHPFERAPLSTKASFGLSLLPFGIPWPLELTESEPMRRYVDTSQNLLYREWRHEHLFEPTPDGCRYMDAVTFIPALPAQKLAAILTRRVFLHRHLRAAKHLPADPQATAVGVLRVDEGKASTEVIDDRAG